MSGKGEKTREAIIDAAYMLFAKKGFKQVTMKDVCEVTDMSRGGLYSHFAGTGELFEALLERIAEKEPMDFYGKIKKGIPAVKILDDALKLMEKEVKKPDDSLSLAIYEYAETVDSNVMERYNKEAKARWSRLLRYGIENGEFRDVNVSEIVNVILFSYQGVRMWSRIIPVKAGTFRSITDNIRKQLTGE